MKKILLISVCFIGLALSGYSQKTWVDSLSLPASIQSYELVKCFYPLTTTSNPAALGQLNIGSLSSVSTGYKVLSEEVRYFNQPGTTRTFFVNTSGYKRLSNVQTYGSFEYRNEAYEDILYNNTMMFDSRNPYILGDSLGGRQSMEAFLLLGKAAINVSDRFTIAFGADYSVSIGGKNKDPRNENIISELTLSTGATYNIGRFRYGVNLSYYNYLNDIDLYVFGNTQHVALFRFKGMGQYNEETNVSSESQRYYGEGIIAGAQAEYSSGRIKNVISAELSYNNNEGKFGTQNKKSTGLARYMDFMIEDHLYIKNHNSLNAFGVSATFLNTYGDGKTVQDKEIIITEGAYIYKYTVYTYIIDINQIIAINNSFGIDYKYLKTNNSGLKDMEIGLELYYNYDESGFYPVETGSLYSSTNATLIAYFGKSIAFKKLNLFPAIKAYLRQNMNSSINYRKPDQFIESTLLMNYYATSSSLYGGTLKTEIEIPLVSGFMRSFYINPEFSYFYSPSFGEVSATNYFASATIGFTF